MVIEQTIELEVFMKDQQYIFFTIFTDVQDSSRQSLQQVSKLTSLQLNSATSKCSTVNCDNYVNSEGSCCKHCSSWLTLDVDSPHDVLIYAQ